MVTLMWGLMDKDSSEKNGSSFRLWWLRECFCPSQTRRIKFKFESEAPPPAVMFWSVIFWMDLLLCGVLSRTEGWLCVVSVNGGETGEGWFQVLQVTWSLLVSERVQVEGRVQEAPQLDQVSVFVSCGGSGCRVSASIPETQRGCGQRLHGGGQMVWSWWRWWWLPNGLGFLRGGPDARLHVVIVTLVLVLLLTPDQVGVGEALRLRLHLVEGERGELRGETACRYCLFTSHCRRVLFPVIP